MEDRSSNAVPDVFDNGTEIQRMRGSHTKKGKNTTVESKINDGTVKIMNGNVCNNRGKEKKFGILVPTVSYKEVPKLFQEPYVFTGYRTQHQRWLYYILSIFQVQNECMNVWTHIVAFIYMLYKFWSYTDELDFVQDPYSWPLAASISSSIILYAISFGAHCLQSKSQLTHYTCFMFDYSAIGLYAFGSVIAHHAYCMEEEIYVYFKDIFIPVGFMLALNCCICCAISKSMYERPYPFQRRLWQITGVLGAYSWLIIPVIHQVWNCYSHGVKCDDSIPQHSQQLLYFFTAGFFFASDIPQRFIPGTCDFLGHSHQIFHIGIAMVTIKQMDACVIDLRNERTLLQNRPTPTIFGTFGLLGAILILNIICVALFRNYVKRKHKLD